MDAGRVNTDMLWGLTITREDCRALETTGLKRLTLEEHSSVRNQCWHHCVHGLAESSSAATACRKKHLHETKALQSWFLLCARNEAVCISASSFSKDSLTRWLPRNCVISPNVFPGVLTRRLCENIFAPTGTAK